MHRHKLQRRVCLGWLGWICLPALSQPLPDAQTILQASDGIRNPPGSFSVQLQLTEYRQKKLANSNVLMVYARPADAGGEYSNLVRFVAPARDAGKLMLRNGLDLWFYDPSNQASVRISPQQRLLGQASNGDVMTTQLARDYDATLAGTQALRDGEGQIRNTHLLHLKARRADLPYPRIEYWVEQGSHQPVRARYFTAEGRLLKTAWFRAVQQVLGQQRPTQTVIVDGLDPGWVTVMQMSNHQLRDIPAAWLQRDYLPRWKAEP